MGMERTREKDMPREPRLPRGSPSILTPKRDVPLVPLPKSPSLPAPFPIPTPKKKIISPTPAPKGTKLPPPFPGPKPFPGIVQAGNGDGDDDAAIKAARVAAIKAANLSNKVYNVGSSTAPDLSLTNAASGILLGRGGVSGGGGSSGYISAESGGGSFFSSIPSIVWIILAVAGGWFVIKSSKGKGKLF